MNTKKSERGQALILLAAGMIGLIGLLALALDGGQGFADRRHAQNAADNAAYAAAYSWIQTAKSQGAAAATSSTAWHTAGMNVIEQNGYTPDNTTSRSLTIAPAPSGVCPENSQGVYITASIDSVVDTWFAPIVGVEELHNSVTARSQACLTYTTKLFNGQAVVALGQSGKTMIFDGGTKVIVDGSGLFVNSSSTCALDRNGTGNGDV
ncbi:MAG: pilus assembly protein TadG-related protein, partial [Anaerolineales bacterium]